MHGLSMSFWEDEKGTHLETLGIPVLDLANRGHVTEIARQRIELLDAMSETNREFLWLGPFQARSRLCGWIGCPRVEDSHRSYRVRCKDVSAVIQPHNNGDKRRNTSKSDTWEGARKHSPARNWLALRSVPWLGCWPKRTICWSDTVTFERYQCQDKGDKMQ